jgi:hypothetical protein
MTLYWVKNLTGKKSTFGGAGAKDSWGKGPWEKEYDEYLWIDPPTKLFCSIRRGPVGSLCGYVGVRAGHPWFGVPYDDIDCTCHGGLTYAAETKVTDWMDWMPSFWTLGELQWVVGFDCAHLYDLMPGTKAMFDQIGHTSAFDQDNVYRDVEYVKDQVRMLAYQAWKVGLAAPALQPPQESPKGDN